MTTYDDIFTTFISINKTNPVNIPTDDEKKYDMIHSAVLHYNNRMRASITWDDELEQLSIDLDNDQLILIAHYLKLACLENDLDYFVSVWSGFQSELKGNYRDQQKGKQELVNREDDIIEKIIFNMTDDYL
jgi:Mg/Co/Ni transporter MgtE